MIVDCIEFQEDRILLYGKSSHYYLIASKDCDIKVGETAIYEPYGLNFGWFVRKKENV